MKASRGHSIPFLEEPTPESGLPLYRQLYRRIREGVLRGAIGPGTRLPSARTIAREEGVSRNTVEAAFSQLQAEGFVVRRVGSGTWVPDDLPDRLMGPPRARLGSDRSSEAADEGRIALSDRGRRLDLLGTDPEFDDRLTFAPCLPGVEAIPLDAWSRIAARYVRRPSSSLTPPPRGSPALREAIAGYLHLHRGVRCAPDQILVVNSTQQALALTTHVLLNPGDDVWFEDPGYVSARRALLNGGARVRGVPVDHEGLDVRSGVRRVSGARMAYVTPSHQFPMGVTLSLARRLELLDWAGRTDGWIFEDDYDSELRHRGRPLAPMQSLDEEGRVLYAGTFNKILFPSLRIAYLVLPSRLVEPFVRAKEVMDGSTSPLLQSALAAFIEEGHFSVHLRRVRDLYRERRDAFVAAAECLTGHGAQVGPADAGMHLALQLPPDMDAARVSEQARRAGVAVPALSAYAMESPVRGLLVHYGSARPDRIERAVEVLHRLLS
jgi:GntR family transcriptional regulator / MocR family aminotransferase